MPQFESNRTLSYGIVRLSYGASMQRTYGGGYYPVGCTYDKSVVASPPRAQEYARRQG